MGLKYSIIVASISVFKTKDFTQSHFRYQNVLINNPNPLSIENLTPFQPVYTIDFLDDLSNSACHFNKVLKTRKEKKIPKALIR